MSHQFRNTEYINAGFDGSRSVGMPKIVGPEWRLDSALLQRSLMRWLEFGHWLRPVVPVSDSSRKEILALCLRNPPIENRQCSKGDWNATGAASGKLNDMATLPIPFPGKTGRPRNNVDAKRILALRAQGLSWRMIGKRLHVGVGTAFRAAQGRSKSVS